MIVLSLHFSSQKESESWVVVTVDTHHVPDGGWPAAEYPHADAGEAFPSHPDKDAIVNWDKVMANVMDNMKVGQPQH